MYNVQNSFSSDAISGLKIAEQLPVGFLYRRNALIGALTKFMTHRGRPFIDDRKKASAISFSGNSFYSLYAKIAGTTDISYN